MKCTEFAEQAAAYALDALEEHERLACERHLRDEGPHDGCEALAARYTGAVAQLGASVAPARVSDGVWHAIESRLGLRRKRVARPARVAAVVGWAVAAVALLGALWMQKDAQYAWRRQREATISLATTSGVLARAEAARLECAALLERATDNNAIAREAVALLEDEATRIAPMAASDARPFRATALYNPVKKRALAVSSSMQPVTDKDYALWVIAAGAAPKPAGFLRFDSRGVAVGEFDARLLAGATPSALAISLENKGGVTAPTDVILVAKLL